MAHVGVILSGCGVFDGSEIHEAVSVLLSLDQRGATYQCLAPRTELDVVDHTTQQAPGEKRDVFVESARIARGDIKMLDEVKGDQFDAIILPGGFGAAKNLCTFAFDGPDCSIEPQVQRVLTEAQQAGKPLGFACIAPAVAAKAFGESLHPSLTIGHDPSTAAGLEALGAKHVECDVTEIVTDEQNNIVTTPAYMLGPNIANVFTGIDKMVEQVLARIGQAQSVG